MQSPVVWAVGSLGLFCVETGPAGKDVRRPDFAKTIPRVTGRVLGVLQVAVWELGIRSTLALLAPGSFTAAHVGLSWMGTGTCTPVVIWLPARLGTLTCPGMTPGERLPSLGVLPQACFPRLDQSCPRSFWGFLEMHLLRVGCLARCVGSPVPSAGGRVPGTQRALLSPVGWHLCGLLSG